MFESFVASSVFESCFHVFKTCRRDLFYSLKLLVSSRFEFFINVEILSLHYWYLRIQLFFLLIVQTQWRISVNRDLLNFNQYRDNSIGFFEPLSDVLNQIMITLCKSHLHSNLGLKVSVDIVQKYCSIGNLFRIFILSFHWYRLSWEPKTVIVATLVI